MMDLDRAEVSDTSESSLHCTICSAYHSCPVEAALYVLLSATAYVFLYMCACKHYTLFRVVHGGHSMTL